MSVAGSTNSDGLDDSPLAGPDPVGEEEHDSHHGHESPMAMNI